MEKTGLRTGPVARMPAPKSMAGRVALVTGGAGGIGSATAERYLREGACVMLADIDDEALSATQQLLTDRYSADVVRSVNMNVTDEDAVASAYADIAAEFGGVDILVSNAGIASSAPVTETSLDLWNRNMSILSTGYFLVSREAFKLFQVQDMGGAVVFVASKNGLAASPNASAYCTAKASEIHLARCLALEGAPMGVRVNVVNPDAVLKGSKIWQGDWLDQRAGTYGTDKDGLEGDVSRPVHAENGRSCPKTLPKPPISLPRICLPNPPETSSTSTLAMSKRSPAKDRFHDHI
ncbi:putative oxidoreductase YuxG [Nymphon striatum]|nr:putative oxidoreductase YuxG [Nymphon striatum]